MSRTTKLCYNRESGQYEWVSENGYSEAQGGYVYDWDDSPFEREREREERLRERDSWSPGDDMQYYNEFRRTHGI